MATPSKTNTLTERRAASLSAPRPGTARAARRRSALPYNLLSWIAPLVLLLIWELSVRIGLLSPRVLPAPSSVFVTAWNLSVSGVLPNHLWVSLQRAAIGCAIGGSLALILGFTVGLSRLAEAIFDRSIQMIRTIPFLALVPLVILWFGVSETGRIFLVALGVVFPIYINTVLGIRQVDPRFLELGRNYGLSRRELIQQIVLPGALPSILVGLRYALGISWLALVVAETIAANAGIGFMAMDAREFMRTDVIVLAIVVYALLGALVDVIIRQLERRLLVWHPNYAQRQK